jgi:hypothetical protein
VSTVVIVHDADCPNVALARERVRCALERVGLPASWRELDRQDPETPPPWRGFASPTVLVGGQDVVSGEASHAACRLYEVDGGLSGAPSVDAIASALQRSRARESVTTVDGST